MSALMLNGWMVTSSPLVRWGEGFALRDQKLLVISDLALWVWKLRAATRPSSTEGAEFVADILGGS